MESYEALPGTRVRVREGASWTAFAGMGGTIERSFGGPEYPALDVRLENGRLELFWFHQLDSTEALVRHVATEREKLEKRKAGHVGRLLGRPLPCESGEDLRRFAEEDR